MNPMMQRSHSSAATRFMCGIAFLLTLAFPARGQIMFSDPVAFSAGTDGADTYAIASADLNADGKSDVVVDNLDDGTLTIFINTTPPGSSLPSFCRTILPPLTAEPRGIAIGDLNADGKPDIAVDLVLGIRGVSVFVNKTPPGDTLAKFCTQANFVTGYASDHVAIGDLTSDGKPDLAMSNGVAGNISVLVNRTPPGDTLVRFAPKVDIRTGAYDARDVVIGNLNGDAKLDMVVANYAAPPASGVITIMTNTTPAGGALSFATVNVSTDAYSPSFAGLADVNGDGRQDIVSQTSTSLCVLTNPSFSRTDVTPGYTSPDVAIGDLNSDGKPDLAAAGSVVPVFLNTTPAGGTPSFISGIYVPATPGTYHILMADINGDTRRDLLVTEANAGNEFNNTMSVLLNGFPVGTTSIAVSAGWNFVSVPRHVADPNANVVFPGAVSVFRWRTDTRQYERTTTVIPGEGYWASFSTSHTISMTGSAVGHVVQYTPQAGWMILGSRVIPVPLSQVWLTNGATIGNPVWWWNPAIQQYELASAIPPGSALWLKLSGETDITVP